ncbi:MAG: type II toxin-antitoxin system PemK/MazF family toxin [Exilibacterium sp.]
MVARFDVFLVDLNPTKGSEQAGTRPVLVVSPDDMNRWLKTVIVAPMTTKLRGWPTRILIEHGGKEGEVALDQLRTIDKSRLGRNFGTLDPQYHDAILDKLSEIFSK